MRESFQEPAPQPFRSDRFCWSFAIYAAVAATIPGLVIPFFGNWDFIGFLYLILVVPLIGLGVLIASIACAARRKPWISLSLFAALAVYLSVSGLMIKSSSRLRGDLLWALHSKEYKAQVLAQPASAAGGLRYIDWFGWGMFAQDTEEYLVYDPSNSLAHKDPHTGRYGLLRCDVWRVQRLEDHWYAVTFFTNTGWDESCDVATPSSQYLVPSTQP